MREFFDSLFGTVLSWILALGLPLGFLYWLWLAIKVGGFAMFAFAFFPFTTPIAAILGAWIFFFGMPEWVYNLFII
jgi:hypothetical protein